MSERSLRGANLVFFGGSHGIGRAAALQIAARGASVLIVGRGAAAGASTVQALRTAGAAHADFVAADLSTLGGMKAAADAVVAWQPRLHGVMHTAMSALREKKLTADGLEFAFALQYMARATLNRLLLDALAASGDGRIVHIAGNVPGLLKVNLDDLQFERTRWGFFKAVLGTHVLGYLHAQEAARRWQQLPVSIALACVGSTRTKAMLDPEMPLIMRAMGRFGTSPERSTVNAVRLLTQGSATGVSGTILRSPGRYAPAPLRLAAADAQRLWTLTSELAAAHGVALP